MQVSLFWEVLMFPNVHLPWHLPKDFVHLHKIDYERVSGLKFATHIWEQNIPIENLFIELVLVFTIFPYYWCFASFTFIDVWNYSLLLMFHIFHIFDVWHLSLLLMFDIVYFYWDIWYCSLSIDVWHYSLSLMFDIFHFFDIWHLSLLLIFDIFRYYWYLTSFAIIDIWHLSLLLMFVIFCYYWCFAFLTFIDVCHVSHLWCLTSATFIDVWYLTFIVFWHFSILLMFDISHFHWCLAFFRPKKRLIIDFKHTAQQIRLNNNCNYIFFELTITIDQLV